MNKWDSKRIAFISILIAMSISFVIIGTRFAALTSIPSIKLSFAGLPIKIIGFIFGPISGFIIGFITDLISFIFIPTFYYPMYSVALGISGMLPGIMAIFFNYFYKRLSKERILRKLNIEKIYVSYCLTEAIAKNNSFKEKIYQNKINKISDKINKIGNWDKEKRSLNFALIFSVASLVLIIVSIIIPITFMNQEIISNSFDGIMKILSNKHIYIVVIVAGVGTCIILLLVARFMMKPKNFLMFAPIITFVVFTEFINIPVVAYADDQSLHIPFLASLISSLATSFIKIWFNTIIITFAIKIVMPLITKKTFNGFE